MFKIDRWYDRHTKNWIVQLKDATGNQIGEATIVYTKKEAIKEEQKLKEQYEIE